MGYVKSDEVRGAHIEGQVVCAECLTSEEWDNLTEDQIITDDTITEDDLYFCDRGEHKKRL
jgi:hypothetical protein